MTAQEGKERRGDIVAGSLDVSDNEARREAQIYDCGAVGRRSVVVGGREAGVAYGAKAFSILFAFESCYGGGVEVVARTNKWRRKSEAVVLRERGDVWGEDAVRGLRDVPARRQFG